MERVNKPHKRYTRSLHSSIKNLLNTINKTNMGTDIRSMAEVKRNGKWEATDFQPFDWRNYSIFAFLADVRNYDHCECITGETRGLPYDSEYLNELVDDDNWYTYGTQSDTPKVSRKNEILDGNYSTQNHMTLKELLDWDYDKEFENRRTFKATYRADGSISGGNGAHIADVLRGYVKHSKAKSEELEALNYKYRKALERIRDWQYNPETTVYQLAEQALNHNLKDNG